jgi:hypothetical protein
MEKKTKAMQFAEIKEVIAAVEVEGRDEMVAFLDEQIASLAAKAEKAKERAAARKAEGDELRAVVKSVLTDEVQTIDAIVAQIEGEDVSKAKVTARLSQLVKADEAVKEMISVEGRKLTAYKLA